MSLTGKGIGPCIFKLRTGYIYVERFTLRKPSFVPTVQETGLDPETVSTGHRRGALPRPETEPCSQSLHWLRYPLIVSVCIVCTALTYHPNVYLPSPMPISRAQGPHGLNCHSVNLANTWGESSNSAQSTILIYDYSHSNSVLLPDLEFCRGLALSLLETRSGNTVLARKQGEFLVKILLLRKEGNLIFRFFRVNTKNMHMRYYNC
jgi:hypothetical protein